MTCPTPWILSMHADGELPPADANAVARHAQDCAACRGTLAALATERDALRTLLQSELDGVSIPTFVAPSRPRAWFALAAAVAVVGTLIDLFWSGVAAAVPSGLHWLNPFAPGELAERAVRIVSFIANEDTTMWTSTVNVIGFVFFLVLLAGGAAVAARHRPAAALLAALLALVVPFSGQAFEIRRGPLVTLAAGELVDDTLLATGETIVIDGDVSGDLLAFGRSVTVRGSVAGDLIAGAETVSIEGAVGGNVVGGGRAFSLLGASVGRNVYGGGRDFELATATSVDGNAIAFGETVTIDGNVRRDLKGFGQTVTIGGTVDGDVEGFGEAIVLLPSARIGGDLVAHIGALDDLRVAAGAVVGGATREELGERTERERNRYLTVGYYVGEIVLLGAAFVTGLLLLAVFPALRTLSLPNAMVAVRTGGIGLAAAVALPIAALVACITVIGIPLGILIFVLGALGLYLGKAVVAQLIGSALFRAPHGLPHYAVTLLTGLVLIRVVINVPFVGGFANLLLTLVGFGLLVSVLVARLQRGPLE